MDKIIRRPPKMKLVGIERWSYLEPPKFKRIFPPEIPGATSDWDFGSNVWQLDTSIYISAPSSLKLSNGAVTYALLCKYSGTINIPQGRIVSYLKSSYNWGNTSAPYIAFFFRNQTAIGSTPDWTKGYAIKIQLSSSLVYLYRDGSQLGSTISITNKPSDATQWNQYRVTWWTDPEGAGLMIRLEYWDGSEWVKMINDLNDPHNKYATSSINRVGLTAISSPVWVDDTEIWSA